MQRKRRIKKRYLLLGLALLLFGVINAPGLLAVGYRWFYQPKVNALPQMEAFKTTDRILLVSPHPDDESLCCAGAIQQALQVGAQVWVVWLTNGDGFEWDAIYLERNPRPSPQELRKLAELRTQEARAAAQTLGIPKENLFFLGYPDRGLLRLILDYYAQPYTSRYTQVSKVPYPEALSPGAAYTGANLEHDFSTVLDRTQPTLILAPSPQDAHPDHRAAADLALRVLGLRGHTEKLRYWIVHGGLEWPLPKGLHKGLPLEAPPRGKGLSWRRLQLSAEQVDKKLSAIRSHQSQTRVLSHFMLAFVRQNELFSTTPLP